MKKICLFAAVAALCLGLSGCTFFETDTEALMKPPVFTEEQEKLNAALMQVAGENYVLKYPAGEEANSAFIFRDLDNDGTEEAMAFYSLLDESTRINILARKGEEWVSVYEAAGFYGDIEKISFADIDGKGPALAVKWDQDAAVYRYENERLEMLFQSSCEGFEITDIDGNGKDEILLFRGSSVGRTLVNAVFSEDGKIIITEDTSINAEFGKILSVKNGTLSEGKNACFIDSVIYEGVYLTEIITLEEGRTVRHFIPDFIKFDDKEEETGYNTGGTIVIIGGDYGKRGILLRNTAVYCLDTNGDGIMEMPVEVREDYAREASDDIFFLNYMQCSGAEAESVWNGIANTENGYLFAIPEKWNKTVRAFITSSGDELTVTDKEGRTILEVRAVLKSDYQDKYEEYFLAAENGDKNYYIKTFVTEESEFHLPEEELKNAFIFI